ncbi:MAG: glutathione binding-like protein [Pseudomonadota bacterium]
MNYLEPREAQQHSGLRLVLTIGVPGPWGESAKKIFEFKGIDYVPVAQHPGQPNADLVAWTGIRNAPIALFEGEPPRTNFQDIVALAERLAPEPALVPQNTEDRWLCFAISNEICGEGGYGWMRRHVMGTRPRTDAPAADAPPMDPQTMRRAYGGTEAERAAAPGHIATILAALEARLARQRAAGSDYFVGGKPSACDIHWACFSALLRPLPQAVNPMPAWLRPAYAYQGDACDPDDYPELLAHRDRMFERHLGLPLDY